MINLQLMNNNNYYQNLIYQNMLMNAYNNQNYIYQRNIPFQYNNVPNYQNIYYNQPINYYNYTQNYQISKNIPINKKINDENVIRIKKEEKEIKKEEEKEENYFEKINMIKISHRRRSSIDTTICDSSFNLSEEEKTDDENEEKEEIKEIDKKRILINDSKNIYTLKKKLSNISEANSESSKTDDVSDTNDDLNNSFFSDTEIKKEEYAKSENSINNVNKAINIKNTMNTCQNKNETKIEKYEGNGEFENTEILRVNVKISKDKIALFRLKRYDDVFETIKLFCEINSVDERLIKPLIIKSLSAMNTIYQIMNCKLDKEQIKLMKKIKNF